MGIRWGAATEKAEVSGAFGGNLVPFTRRDKDCIAWGDRAFFAVEFHRSGPFEDEIDLFTFLVVVAVSASARLEARFGETLVFNRGIRAIENASNCGAVGGGKRFLFCDLIDCHLGV